MQKVPVDFPELSRVVLDVNYRCSQKIIAHARQLIEHNSVRFVKNASPASDAAGIVRGVCARDKKEEWKLLAEKIRERIRNGQNPGDIAVLTRTHAGMRGSLLYLWKEGIACDRNEGIQKLSEHFIWKDIYAYLKIGAGTRERKHYLTILRKPERYLSRRVFSEEIIEENK